MRTNINNLNFNGYKNIIHNDISQNNMRFTFLSMQLNDEGVSDLAEFKKIRQLQNVDSNNDVLSIFYFQNYNSQEWFYFNDRAMYLGKELRKLRENDRNTEFYKLEEKVALKAYTLIASLTNRMMHNDLSNTDSAFPHVVLSTMESFMKNFSTKPSRVFNFLQTSIINNKQLEKTAFAMNSLIAKNMRIFFK